MPDLWEGEAEDDAFALPGDEKILSGLKRKAGVVEAEPEFSEPEPDLEVVEAAVREDETGRLHGPDGKFVPKAKVEPETPAEEGEPEPELTAAEKLLQAKGWADPNAIAEGYVNLEQELGRLRQEIGDLRRIQDVPVQETPQAQPTYYDADVLRDYLELHQTQIPTLAADAWRAGNTVLTDAVVAYWEEIDKPAAKRFERELIKAEMRRDQAAEMQQQAAVSQTYQTTADEFAKAHPDFDKFAPAMREIAADYPNMLRVLASDDAEGQREVLDFLYTKATLRESANLGNAATELARKQVQEEERARAEATVASATRAHPDVTRSPEEIIGQEWAEMEDPLKEGWNI